MFNFSSLAGCRPGLLLASLALGLLAGCQSNSSSQTEEKAATETAGSAKLAALPPRLYVRRNAASAEAAPDLAALQTALDSMRKLPCTDPRSWYYQGAMHNVPGHLKQNPFCPGFVDTAKTKFGWDGCTHDALGKSEYHFLIWHRLYTWHFEQIVRQLSGKADFALPYWNYTVKANQQMPAIYRQKGNALYVPDGQRYPPLNQGKPIWACTRPQDSTTVQAGLDTANIYQYYSYSTFDRNIDPAPHGLMHVFIGCGLTNAVNFNPIYQRPTQGGMMGNVPSAAFDPIFWVHHANIDYLWATWSGSPRGQAPVLDSMKANPWPYQFITADGKPVSYTMEQAYELAMHPDYRYDVLQPVTSPDKRLVLTAKTPRQEQPRRVLTTATVRKTLTAGQFTAQLPVPAAQTSLLKSATPRPTAGRRQRLLLQLVVSVPSEPRNAYAVYVRNQGATDGALASKKHLAGVLTFFGLSHQHGDDGSMDHMNHDMMNMPRQRTFLFDVTDEVDASSFKGGLDVQVVPAGEKPVPVTIEKMTLLTQAI